MMSSSLDRTAPHAGTPEQAAHYHASRQPAPPTECPHAAYLNSVAYGYDLDNPPRLDRTAFAARQHAQ